MCSVSEMMIVLLLLTVAGEWREPAGRHDHSTAVVGDEVYLWAGTGRLVILLHAWRCANHAIHGRFNPVQPTDSADHDLRTSKTIRTDVIRNVRSKNG